MKARILTVGNKMPSWIQEGFDEYHKRIQYSANAQYRDN